jgi:hypothetical protein
MRGVREGARGRRDEEEQMLRQLAEGRTIFQQYRVRPARCPGQFIVPKVLFLLRIKTLDLRQREENGRGGRHAVEIYLMLVC